MKTIEKMERGIEIGMNERGCGFYSGRKIEENTIGE